MWTTETINDDDAHTLLREQMRRRIAEMERRAEMERLERQRRERAVATEAAEAWGQRTVGDRVLRANWPQPDRRATEVERRREAIGFLKDFNMMDDKLPKEKKEDKILKPLPDELFEID